MAEVLQYTSGMSNGFFVRENESVIAVDGGGVLGVDEYIKVCGQCGIAPESPRLIVATHSHVDHTVNLGAIRAICKAPIVCHRNAAEDMRNGKFPRVFPRDELGRRIFREIMSKRKGEPIPYLPNIIPDLTFEGEFDLKPYGISGKLIETFGHSLSCVSAVLESGQAIVGDLLVVHRFDGVTPMIAYFGYDPDPDKVNALIFKSAELLIPMAETFYSGHGGPFTREQFTSALSAARE